MRWSIIREDYESYGYISVEEDGVTLTFDNILDYYSPLTFDPMSMTDQTRLPIWWTLA